MTEYSADQLEELIGIDSFPDFRGVPAAWWITIDDDQLAAWERYETDRNEWFTRAQKLVKSLGLDEGVMISSFGKRTDVVGIKPSEEMRRSEWRGPSLVPEGWRIDSKKGYLLPKRRTKADRDSQANKDFAAIVRVPDSAAYITGLPEYLQLDDGPGLSGHLYPFNVRKGEKCVMAFCAGDPDRAEKSRDHKIAEWWERQPLSTMHALRERKQARK
ncbi:hypothetical protein QLT00_gp09 [Gordonia phage Commandaria]|uniref:Uncharacterized protein n=1 Tax=Gordonia phage Commandaria TaxID=3038364 RepID=A0AAF0GMH1_9CAUD|nr:hypothetical protein QLT00_gp09 [Gordonia phage Commandaria]WGH20792.1 hypothetical protein [Gordonia phage Commandaria]